MNSKQKGARGEREWAEFLRSNGFDAKRGQQFAGSMDSPDVVSSLPFHFEVKRVEALNISKAMEQSIRDSGMRFGSEEIRLDSGKAPVVAHRKNGEKWMVTMLADDWIKIVKKGIAK